MELARHSGLSLPVWNVYIISNWGFSVLQRTIKETLDTLVAFLGLVCYKSVNFRPPSTHLLHFTEVQNSIIRKFIFLEKGENRQKFTYGSMERNTGSVLLEGTQGAERLQLSKENLLSFHRKQPKGNFRWVGTKFAESTINVFCNQSLELDFIIFVMWVIRRHKG